MHGWLYRDLSISACVLLPVGFGVLLARLGVEKRAARSLFAFSFYGCQTAVTACAIWVARIHAEARVLPALALAGWLVTASRAWLVSRFLRSTPKKRGAFILSMAMSNNGFTLLGFVALAAYGEVGLAQATYAQLLYAPFFLLCCFPIARSFGSQAAPQPLARTLLANAIDPRVWLPLTAIAIGLTLNAGLVARLVGLTALDTRILVLYGLVPSALLANMLAVFFDLDSELTSSVFMVSTVSFLLFVLPVYLFWAQPSF